jgi:hypothetical protein
MCKSCFSLETEEDCINKIKQNIWVFEDGRVMMGYSGYYGAEHVFLEELGKKETIDWCTKTAKKHGWLKALELGLRASEYYSKSLKGWIETVDVSEILYEGPHKGFSGYEQGVNKNAKS